MLADLPLSVFVMENVCVNQWEIRRVKQANRKQDKFFGECGMLNLECTKLFTIHIHDRSSKFE
jgi:hypothetical protein